jgi:HK97 family phage portal protein
MGLGKLFRTAPPAPAELRTAGSAFEVIIDGTAVGAPLQSYRGGMGIPGAWRAANLISDLIGSVPWSAYRSRGNNDDPTEELHPTPPLLEQPHPPYPRIVTFSSWALDLVWHGNAFGIIAARNSDGYPTAVYPIPAQQVGARRVDIWVDYPLPIGAVEYQVGGRIFTPFEVVHIMGPCQPGALRGFGVLEAHMDTLGLAAELQRQASSVSRHGVPTGKLTVTNPDATEQDMLDVKAAWLKAQRDRSIAVLNSTTEFEPLSWNPEELELVSARKFSLLEMANIFGIPPHFLGADVTSRTYSNIEQESLDLLKYSMSGHFGRFEQTLSQAFPRGTTVRADLDAFLRADTLTRFQSHQIAITSGFKTPDEVRDAEDMPPLTAAQKAAMAPKAPAVPAVPPTAPGQPVPPGHPAPVVPAKQVGGAKPKAPAPKKKGA